MDPFKRVFTDLKDAAELVDIVRTFVPSAAKHMKLSESTVMLSVQTMLALTDESVEFYRGEEGKKTFSKEVAHKAASILMAEYVTRSVRRV
jgi:hypothetical protein